MTKGIVVFEFDGDENVISKALDTIKDNENASININLFRLYPKN